NKVSTFQEGWAIVDPICTLLFSVIVLCTTIHILRDALVVLLVRYLIYFLFVTPTTTPQLLFFALHELCHSIMLMSSKNKKSFLFPGRPSNIDFSHVFTSLEQIQGVKKVHDLRIWALTMDKVAVSVHLEVAQPQNAQSVLRDTRTMLKRVYGVHESTIQIEGFIAEKDCNRCDVPK
ncbi:hypothetical protein OSTOST_22191, partial [Ostertagia ostertagi]